MTRKTQRSRACRFALQRLEDRTVPAFAAPTSYAAPSALLESWLGTTIVARDFDNDGFADLAVVDPATSAVNVLLNNGDGTFGSPITSSTGASHWALAAGDFNADGNLDLVTNQRWNDGWQPYIVSILYGMGDGTFQTPVQHEVPVYHQYEFLALAVGDVNNDSIDDIVCATSDLTNADYAVFITSLIGNATGSLTAIESAGGGLLWSAPCLADFNEDGNLDLFVGEGLFMGSGDGTFSGYGSGSATGRYAGDFTNDGHQDLAAFGNSAVGISSGNGAAQFGTPVFYSTGVPYDGGDHTIALSDLNSDGLNDLIALSIQPAVSVLLGNADGTLGPVFNQATPAGLDSLTVGDFNGDGFDDFAATDSATGVVKVFLNDGDWTGGTTPPPPSISISDATVTEGNTGTQSATFTISLSSAWTQTVTIQFLTANGTATAGSDFQSTGGTVTFAPGEASRTFTVDVIGDRTPESSETFVVNLSSPTNATIADSQGVGTILDNEPRVSINNVSTEEGRSGTKNFTFTVTLSAAYDQAVTMSFRTVNGTATSSGNKADYIAQTGTVTFNPGETSKTITILVKGDKRRESDETFYVDLFGNSSNSLITKSRGVGTILNDD